MSKSMCISEVTHGVLAYADRIPVNNDPLELLIEEEETEEELNPYPHSSSLSWALT